MIRMNKRSLVGSVMDPVEIEKRYSTTEELFYGCNETLFQFEDFQPFLDKIPQREVDLIEMYYRQDKKQKEIAEFFGVTQGAVSHRLTRARKRLKFLRDMPKITRPPREILKEHMDAFELDLFLFMVETTCQSKTADLLNEKYKLKGDKKMTQIKVRHKFDRYIERLKSIKEKDIEVECCHKLAIYIKNNLYMLHEVILPHFDKGYRVKMARR